MDLALALSLVAILCYAALAGLTIRRGLHVRANWLFTLYLLGMLVWQAAYVLLSLSSTAAEASVATCAMITAASGQFIIFFYFVRALLGIRVRRWVLAIGPLVWLLGAAALWSSPESFISNFRRDVPGGTFVGDYASLLALIAVPNYAFLGYGIASLMRAWQNATSALERNRLRYLSLAIVLTLLGTLTNFVSSLKAYPLDRAANLISALLISYAILRYQLFDITLVLRRGLAYAVVTGGIAITFMLSVLLLLHLIQGHLVLGAALVAISLSLLAAFLLQPWREGVQRWVDRLLFRESYDSRRMLQELSRQVTGVIDLEALGHLLLGRICDAMRLEHAALFLKKEGEGHLVVAAAHGLDDQTVRVTLRSDHPAVQWLAHSDRPLQAHELDTLPQLRSLWTEEKEALDRLNARLFVPLQAKGELVGILAVGPGKSGASLAPHDEMTLATLANQTAIAVENARLFATTTDRVTELTLLQEIGVRLVSSRTLPAVLEVVVEGGARLMGANEAYIALWEPAGERLIAGRGHGARQQEIAQPWEPVLTWLLEQTVRSGDTLLVPDLWLHEAIPQALARQSRFRAVAAQPLRRDETVIGVLAVTHAERHTFTEEELRLLGMLAHQATLAIDNAQLLESERARRQLADTLREVSRVMGSTLELDLLLELVLEQLQRVVPFDLAAILLLAGDRLQVSNARGTEAPERHVGRSFLLAAHPLFSELVHERKPMLATDIQQDPRWIDAADEPPIHAFIGVPLVVHEQPRGLLIMGQTGQGRYADDDLQNALAFANQAAMAIENARLYQEATEEKRKTETILRESFSGIIVTDVDLRIVTFNSGAEAITGNKASDVIGKRLPEVLGPAIASTQSPLGYVIATGQRVPPQETTIQTGGGSRDVLLGTAALHDGHGTLFGYLLSLADITRLKEVDRLKTDIVANVSHELRTPLASIKAYTELLLQNIDGDDRQSRDQFLRIIDHETDRLAELIGDLLNLSRLEAGRFQVRKATLNLAVLLSDVLALLDVQRKNRGLTIRTEVPDDLPALVGDREMVTIILKNLIGNAIKFSRAGGEVVVSLQPTASHLVLQVSDHGIGIPEEALPHLFQKFYRVQTTSESGIEGTGLGLVLTKEAVEAHGGTIEVRSRLGVGTTFTVRLPWQPSSVPDREAIPGERAVPRLR